MSIESAELKEMIGKRITIDDVRHRVAKVAVRAGRITTEDGAVIEAEGVYKRGRGYFYDTPKKGKKKKEEPKETASQRRKREKEEAEKPTRNRNPRNAKVKDEDEAPRQRRKRDTEEPKKPSKKKKIVEAFDQSTSERLMHEVHDILGEQLAQHCSYAVVPVAVGGEFNEEVVRVVVTLMPSGTTQKKIEAYLRDNADSTDMAPSDEEEDDLEDEDLEDDDVEDEDLEEQEEELEDDESEEEEDEDEDEDDEEEDDEEEEGLTVDELVAGIVEAYPTLKESKVRTFVEAYLSSDLIEEKFGDELSPGVTRLQKKGTELELLLVGYDEGEEVVKLVNTETGKFRSASIDDVVRMEVLEEEEEEEDDE